MNTKICLKSYNRSTVAMVAWKVVTAGCLIGIFALGLASAGVGDQGSPVFSLGETASIPFVVQLDGPHSSVIFYTIRLDPSIRPFCVNGLIDENYVLPDRFSVTSVKSDLRFSVNLTIYSVRVQDEGIYIFEIMQSTTTAPQFKRQTVTVLVPPGPADCYPMITDFGKKRIEIHCEAKSGNIQSTISCSQNSHRISHIGEISDNGVVIRGEFLYKPNFPVKCCSHAAAGIMLEDSCGDYIWSPVIAHTTDPTPNTPQRDHLNDDTGITTGFSESEFSRGQKSSQNVRPATISLLIFLKVFITILLG